MTLRSNVEKVKVKSCEAFDDIPEEVFDAMWEYCDELIQSKKVYNIDEVIEGLEDIGDTRAKEWQIHTYEYIEGSKYVTELLLTVTFANSFYVDFEPYYYIEGRC